MLRDRFVQTTEELTGRNVATFISGADLQTETNAELFVLEPLELDTGDEHDAIGAWAEQTLRQASALGGEQGSLHGEQEWAATEKRGGQRPPLRDATRPPDRATGTALA